MILSAEPSLNNVKLMFAAPCRGELIICQRYAAKLCRLALKRRSNYQR